MPLIDVLLIILIIFSIGLIVYVFISLKNIQKNISDMQQDMHELSGKLIPLIEEITEIAEKTNRISSKAELKVSQISFIFDKIEDKFAWLFGKNKKAIKKNPAENLFTQIRAISKGLSSFLQRLTKN